MEIGFAHRNRRNCCNVVGILHSGDRTQKPEQVDTEIPSCEMVSREPRSAIIRSMTTIKLNGEEREISDKWTLADLLNDLQINNRYCAVERNRQLVPREEHSECLLNAGDEIEVVTLVGGG